MVFWFADIDKVIKKVCRVYEVCAKVKACLDKIHVPWLRSDYIDYSDVGNTHLLVIIDYQMVGSL